MSLAQSLLAIAEEEAAKQNCDRLTYLRVECGALAGVMPEALDLCFAALIKGTSHEGARLEIVRKPLKLRCAFCGAVFTGANPRYFPCPNCGETFGHAVLGGDELILARLEAVPAADV